MQDIRLVTPFLVSSKLLKNNINKLANMSYKGIKKKYIRI